MADKFSNSAENAIEDGMPQQTFAEWLCSWFSNKNDIRRQHRLKEIEEETYAEELAAEQAKRRKIEAQRKKAELQKLAEQRQREDECRANKHSNIQQQFNQPSLPNHDHYHGQYSQNYGYGSFETLQTILTSSQILNVNSTGNYPLSLFDHSQRPINTLENHPPKLEDKREIRIQPNYSMQMTQAVPASHQNNAMPAPNQILAMPAVAHNMPIIYHKNVTQTNQHQQYIKIPHPNGTRNIGVIGLAKSGKSFLIRALCGGLSPKALTNPITFNNATFFELNHPNGGFISGSLPDNTPIYDQFFDAAHLSNLSILIICSYGCFREEDYLLLCLAQQKYQIPTIIVRTKLDEWIENSETNLSTAEYIVNDKNYVTTILQNLGFDFPLTNVYNVSAIAIIKCMKDSESPFSKYLQDERRLMEILKLQNSSNFCDKILLKPAELEITRSQNGIIQTFQNRMSCSKKFTKEIFPDTKPETATFYSLILLIKEKELPQIQKINHIEYSVVYYYSSHLLFVKPNWLFCTCPI